MKHSWTFAVVSVGFILFGVNAQASWHELKIGGNCTKNIGADVRNNQEQDVYVINKSGTASATHHVPGQGFDALIDIGGPINSVGLSAVSMALNHSEVFQVGASGQLLHQTRWDNTFFGWTSLGAPPESTLDPGLAPSAVSWGLGRMDVFAVGADHALKHIWYDGGWSGWENLGGVLQNSFAIWRGAYAISARNGQLDVLVLDANYTVWDLQWNGSAHPGTWWWWNVGIDVFFAGDAVGGGAPNFGGSVVAAVCPSQSPSILRSRYYSAPANGWLATQDHSLTGSGGCIGPSGTGPVSQQSGIMGVFYLNGPNGVYSYFRTNGVSWSAPQVTVGSGYQSVPTATTSENLFWVYGLKFDGSLWVQWGNP